MADDPLSTTHSNSAPPAFSTTVYCITGIKTTVFGLEELPKDAKEVSCLWLLHPRLSNQERMAPLANQALAEWHSKSKERQGGRGLIAVSFDQRNHGTRLIESLSNESWRQGNKNHAQDMFGTYR
jgi:hypothetical protein